MNSLIVDVTVSTFLLLLFSPLCAKAASTVLGASGEVAFKNHNYTLICEITLGSISSVAFRKETSIIGSVLYDKGKCIVQNTGETCVPEVCACNGTAAYNWTISNVPESWHNSNMTCDSAFGGAVSNTYTLYVSVQLASANITPHLSTLDLIVGGFKIFSCASVPASRPNASITWYLESTNGTLEVINKGITSRVDFVGSRGLTVINSTLFYDPVPADNGNLLFCRAKSEYSREVTSQKVFLNILFNPSSKPSISTTPPETPFHIDSAVIVECKSNGGNPLANLTWVCDNLQLTRTILDVSNENTSKLQLIVFLNSSMFDGERCICTATHFVGNYERSEEFTFKMIIPSPETTVSTSHFTNNSTTAEKHTETINEKDILPFVVGGVVGSLVVILVCVGAAIYIIRRHRKAYQQPGKLISKDTLGRREKKFVKNQRDRSNREIESQGNGHGNHIYDYIESGKNKDLKEMDSLDPTTNSQTGYLTAVLEDDNINATETKTPLETAPAHNGDEHDIHSEESREYEKLHERDSKACYEQDVLAEKMDQKSEEEEKQESTTRKSPVSGYLEPGEKQTDIKKLETTDL